MTNKRLTKGLNTNRSQIKNVIAQLWDNDFGYFHSIVFFTSNFFAKWTNKMAFFRKYALDVSAVAFIGMIGSYVFFPAMANADMVNSQQAMSHKTVALMIDAMENETKPFGDLPVSEIARPRKTFTVPMTAYTSDPAQTDDTPCITASGMDVCERNQEDVVAANFLPLGTRVRIPELYGDRIFTVQDRMNARYDKRMDFWMKDIKEARKFGLKYATVEVF
jgi:3D (Asp-Asp-Asp) domain-containing protein